MARNNERPPFEEPPVIPMKSYRIEFHVVAFTRAWQVSPQLIEDAIHKTLHDLEAFGIVQNMSVTRSDEDGD